MKEFYNIRLSVTVFPYDVASVQLRPSKFSESGAADVKIKARRFQQIATTNRKCKLVLN